ncbi:MAG: hypothetical protein P1U74_09405 [Legionellaceae bacterium]|nr:hypothetical protein [Legionellaceae bacterium]
MPIKIKKSYFSQSNGSDSENNTFIDKITRNSLLLGKALFVLILAPSVVVASFFSQGAFLILANILLASCVVVGFGNRLFKKEADFNELLISVALIGLLFLLAFYFLPSIPAWGVIGALCVVNLIATSINVFSVLREVLVPPFKLLIHHVCKLFGVEVRLGLFHKKHLDIENSSYDKQAIMFLKQNKFKKEGTGLDEIVTCVNKASDLHCWYVNKYEGSLFGSINNYDSINTVKSARASLANGSHDASYNKFLQKKYNRKQTKLNMLTHARGILFDNKDSSEVTPEVESVLNKCFERDNYWLFKFCISSKVVPTSTAIKEGIKALDIEIVRQKDKIDGCDSRVGLNECMPEGYSFEEPPALVMAF